MPEEYDDQGLDQYGDDPGDSQDHVDNQDSAETWAPSQEEWNQVIGALNNMAPIVQNMAQIDPSVLQGQAPPPQDTGPDFDPFDPTSVQSYISSQIENGVGKALEPFQGLLGMVASEKGEALAKGELERISGEVGEFDKDTAYLIANGMIENGLDPGDSLTRAAVYARDFEQRIREDERKVYADELRRIAQGEQSVDRQPPPQVNATENHRPDQGLTGEDRYRARISAVLGNGNLVMPS